MNWQLKNISTLCEFAIDCVNKTAPVAEYETPFKMIRTTNVKEGFVDLNEVRFVEEDVFKKWTRRSKPAYGDVLLTREAPVGGVGRFTSLETNYFLGQRLFHYRPNPNKLDWNFLAYVLQSPPIQGWLMGVAFGATVPHVKVADAENLKIPCPEIAIQRTIGTILSKYDDLIENNLKRIKLLEELAQITFNEWFAKAEGLPKGWEEVNLGSFVRHEIGGGWGEEVESAEFCKPAYVIRGTDIDELPNGKIENVPFRFHKKYKEIIDEYNKGKDLQATQKAFDDLIDFMEKLDEEDKRAIAEGLDEEALAIFDLLRKDGLTRKEEDQVKQVAMDTLTRLKEEKLRIERWRESIMIAAQVKTLIYDSLQYLPQESYPDNEVDEKTDMVYQHIYTNYPGGMTNVYNRKRI